MTLQKKLYIILYSLVLITTLSTSYFLIRQTVSDKQNYIYDLQLNKGLAYSELIKNSLTNLETEDLSALAVATRKIIVSKGDQQEFNVSIYSKQSDQKVEVNSISGDGWAQLIELPAAAKKADLPVSFYKNGFITSTIPINSDYILLLNNKDDGFFDLFLSYLKKITPYLILILIGVGFVGWAFSRKLTTPLSLLQERTETLAQGDWEVKIPKTNTLEINSLVSSFNSLGKKLYDREQEIMSKERLSAMGQFSAGIAHELKNPLNIISSYSQLLQRKMDTDSKQYKQTNIIINEVHRATKIINELMNFSRQKPLALKEVALNEFTNRINENYTAIKPDSIQFSLNVNTDQKSIKVDEALFFQVITNLLENATQALEETKSAIISLNIYSQLECTIFEIEDNGPGIPEDIRTKVFEPFFTTKTVGKGTGLGLAFCSGIIKQHQGELIYLRESEKSIFRIVI